MGNHINFREVLKNLKQSERPKAILLGNGINNYFSADQTWGKLLNTIYDRFLKTQNENKELDYKYFINYDISYTEFFDVIDSYNLYSPNDSQGNKTTYLIKKFIQNTVANWRVEDKSIEKYSNFLNACIDSNIPILTTNYDSMLINTNIEIFKNHKKEYRIFEENKFTTFKPFYVKKYLSDTYPLNNYYAPDIITDVENIQSHFGIWHIHGMINYFRSIRIGQNDYFGLVNKLTNKIKQNNSINTSKLEAFNYTWLKMFFTSDLLIIGLGLEYSDYVIRWLLNQRYKFNQIHKKELKTYYFYQKGVRQGRRFLFNMLDIDLVNVKYKTMYETLPKSLKNIKNIN